MIYTGEFYDISEDKNLYKVVISTETGGQTRTITLGGTPFVTEMDSSDETIYIPAKYQTATVSVIAADYMFDVYSGKAHGTKIELFKNGNIEWVGYTTPNLYNQGFVEDREEFSIECIDGLSTLQYMKYKAAEKTVISFSDLIKKLLSACECYKDFYFALNTMPTGNDYSTFFLDKLSISEDNFFKEKDDNEEDDDVAWTCLEVLEELCRFMGVTAISYKDSVLFLDYDAIRNIEHTNNYYWHYSIEDNSIHERTQLTFIKNIDEFSYAGTNATLSLVDVYNKITVKDDIYTFDNIVQDIFSDGKLINITSDKIPSINVDNRHFWTLSPRGMKYVDNGAAAFTDTYNQFLIDTAVVKRDGNDKKKTFFVASQYFKHPNIKTYLYDWKGNVNQVNQIQNPDKIGWDDLMKYYGCVLKKEFALEISYSTNNTWNTLDGETAVKKATEDISQISYNDYIMFLLRGGDNPTFYVGDYTHEMNYHKFPMFTYTIPQSSIMYGGENAYLLIKGSFIFSHNDWDAYNKGGYEYNSKYDGKVLSNWEYVPCNLQWGDYFWNGDNWVNGFGGTFRLYFDTKGDRTISKNDFTLNDLKIRNTSYWWLGLESEGYAIPMPNNKIMNAEISFTMYTPFQQYDNANYRNTGHDGRAFFGWLKNFKIEAKVANPYVGIEFDTDTVYTNIINENNVNNLEDISFKICTWDNKQPNYSSVVVKESERNIYYLDQTYNHACHIGEQEWMGWTGKIEDEKYPKLRQEEHLIYRLVNQYSTPCKKLELTLHNDNVCYGRYTETIFNDTCFIVDSINTDYKNNSQQITLIEKK